MTVRKRSVQFLPFVALFAASAVWFASGCGSAGRVGSPDRESDAIGPNDIHFKDDVAANSQPGAQLLGFEFLDREGKKHHPKDYLGQKHLVLVFVRGYNGSICPYCSSYTSSLISNYAAIAKKGAEVLLVYPVVRSDQSIRLDEFLQATFQRTGPDVHEPPFPVVLDIGLKAVDALGIRKDLSKPATYILDKQGEIRFAYVGAFQSDRPSIKAILGQLDQLAPGAS